MKTLYVKSKSMVGSGVVDEGARRYQMSMARYEGNIVPFANL
jgi:hypothetical protein